MPARVIIGADLVPTKSNEHFFSEEKMNEIVSDRVFDLLTGADLRIFNLEVPLTEKEKPIKKCGPNLAAPLKCINGYRQLGIDFLTLANNHIMDQDIQGLESTLKILDEYGIAYAGAGENLIKAACPYVCNLSERMVGIYCCAEHEFSIAEEDRPGANPFDPLESLDHISLLKKNCDYLICLYHGGREHYRYPSPNLQKRCRKIVEKGADLVICQHSHCIGCEEKWKDGTIVYGQGNFLFDHSNSEFWQTGILVQIDFDKQVKISYVPIIKNGNGVRTANESESAQILGKFYERSQQIQSPGFVNIEYEKYAADLVLEYVLQDDCLGASFLFRGINRLSGGKLRRIVAGQKIRRHRERLINQYECEAHQELILKGLKTYG